MYKRKTVDEYHIQGNNGYGWETETTEETYKEAKEQLKCYRDNVNYPMRILKKRVPIEGGSKDMITIKINTGNATFEEDLELEVSRILMELAMRLKDGEHPSTLKDYNGNTVGTVKY